MFKQIEIPKIEGPLFNPDGVKILIGHIYPKDFWEFEQFIASLTHKGYQHDVFVPEYPKLPLTGLPLVRRIEQPDGCKDLYIYLIHYVK